jgi:hypothetical protein
MIPFGRKWNLLEELKNVLPLSQKMTYRFYSNLKIQFVLICIIFCYPLWTGMEETTGSANRPPVGISQALLTALAARGRSFAPPSGSGSGLGLRSVLGTFDPYSAQGAGRTYHSASTNGTWTGDSSSAHTEGGGALGPSASAPSSVVGSSMTDLD